jgi:hypothetical protein
VHRAQLGNWINWTVDLGRFRRMASFFSQVHKIYISQQLRASEGRSIQTFSCAEAFVSQKVSLFE